MSGSQDEIPPPPPPPPSSPQTPTQQTPHTVSTIKLPILKKGEYDIWAMKMEHYLAHTDYPIWEVIQNGNGPVSITTDTQGQIKVLPPRTAEEIVARERERKARTTLLMALPEDHLAKFHKMTDAKEMWDAIKSRFGGNDESKKMQKYILKQQFEGFSVSNSEGLHKGYDRFQSLLSQLEIHGAGVSTEDANQKFLRSLPSAWSQVSLIMRTKPGVDSLSFNDLYNNLRVFENDVKGSTASSSSSQNVAFVSENTNSNNDVSTAYGVSNTSGQNPQYEQISSYSLLANQSSCPQLDHEDLEQLDEYDLEEMDLKWQVAMISMRIKKIYKKTGRKLQFDAKEPVGFDKTKVECYNYHNTEHFGLGYGDHRYDGILSYENEVLQSVFMNKESELEKQPLYDGILSYENEVLQSVFMNKESELEKQPLYDRFVTAGGMHVVPPPMTGNYMPSRPDIEVDYSQFTYGPKQTQPSESESQSSEFDTFNKNGDWVGSLSVRKQCFVCGSLNHLIRDCDFHEKRMARKAELNNGWNRKSSQREIRLTWNNVIRVNKQNQFVPSAILTRTGKIPVNTARSSVAVGGKEKGKLLLSPQHVVIGDHKDTTGIMSPNTMVDPVLEIDYPHRALKNKGIVDSGWSRHMTGNQAYLAELQDFNGGPIAFGGSKGYITGKEFKNKDVIEFCGSKGIKREYSNARTPQQNGVAERKNRTLIEADSFLPNTFWAEAVSTACYVLNKVLVTKPHNKTPYELLTGKIPIISYLRPFGCHVTILNTIDHLGKFARKSDEGFLVGYSLQSKAFRVYNLETKRVEENLHITFLENKPNVVGKGPTWLFDLDYLTNSMNYQPVRLENQDNKHAGQQEANHNAGIEDIIDAEDSKKEDESAQDCFVLPIWSSYSSIITPELKTNAKREGPREEEQVFLDELERLKRQEKDANKAAEALRKEFAQETNNLVIQVGAVKASSTNLFSTVSTPAKASSTNLVNTVSTPVSTASPHDGLSLSDLINPEQDDSEIPPLEDIYQNSTDGIFTHSSYDDEGAVADFTNLETVVNVSPIPTSRIISSHPSALILGDPTSAVQTRSKVNKSSGAHAFVSYVQKQRRNNHKDFQHCLFACFLSQNEPKKISEALEDESWVDAMQEELLQFKIQKVWILVDLPFGKKAIGTKWVYQNKKDERGVVVRNKARLVAQGHRQEEVIDCRIPINTSLHNTQHKSKQETRKERC
ncbi:putative ribonuclease H-like domain-containing protein [Tanacetum coccineum]